MKWKKAFATHEEPQILSTGPWLGNAYPGVALPCKKAEGKWVILRYGDNWTVARVMDIGPWCTDDDDYVFGDSKPRAEIYKGQYCPLRKGSSALPSVPDGKGGFRQVEVCNGAALDLFPATAEALRIPKDENVFLEWSFIDFP